MIRGSCLCGGVRYEIEGQIGPALNCHCSMCRKATGAAYRSRVAVPHKNFRWLTGQDLLTRYVSSPTTTRTFCKVCGSTLVSLFHDNPETLGLPMGTFDDDPGIRPVFHVLSVPRRRGSKSRISCRSSIRFRRQRSSGKTAPKRRSSEGAICPGTRRHFSAAFAPTTTASRLQLTHIAERTVSDYSKRILFLL